MVDITGSTMSRYIYACPAWQWPIPPQQLIDTIDHSTNHFSHQNSHDFETVMLDFKRINFDQNLDLCIKFREDSFRASFPGSNDWKELWNPDEYANWIQQHAARFPDGAVHIWFENTIIGQLEFSYGNGKAHVNLHYLAPTYRGSGLAQQAHDHIANTLRAHHCKHATLRASPTNLRALSFYAKTGWQDLGQDPDYPQVHRFELIL